MARVIKAQRGREVKTKTKIGREPVRKGGAYGPNNLALNSGRHKGDVRWTRRQQFLDTAYIYVLECYGDVKLLCKFLNTYSQCWYLSQYYPAPNNSYTGTNL